MDDFEFSIEKSSCEHCCDNCCFSNLYGEDVVCMLNDETKHLSTPDPCPECYCKNFEKYSSDKYKEIKRIWYKSKDRERIHYRQMEDLVGPIDELGKE